MISCLTSSYFYAYVGSFAHPDGDWWTKFEIVYEMIFLVDMGVNFITEFRENGSGHAVRDISRIVIRYLKGYFILDLIPLLPATHMGFELQNF